MVNYNCEKCKKIFERKDFYQKHLKRKIPCDISVKSLSDINDEVSNLKNELTIIKNLVGKTKMSQELKNRKNEDIILNTIDKCHDLMYSEEAIVNEKAMHDLMRLLFIRLLEPMIVKNKIDIMDKKYYDDTEYHKYLPFLKWSTLMKNKGNIEQNDKNFKIIWKKLLGKHPLTKRIFKEDKGFNMSPETLFKCSYIFDKNIKPKYLDNLNYDIKGEIYEKFINKYMSGGGKDLGQFFTKRSYINVIYNLLNLEFSKDTKIKVWDPCMGTGGFLTYIKKKHRDSVEIYGNDIEPDTYIFALMNAILNSEDDVNNLKNVNSLHDIDPDTKFNLILTNPPFGTKIKYKDVLKTYKNNYCQNLIDDSKNDDKLKKKLNNNILNKFKEIIPYDSNKGVSIFLQLCMYKLEAGGKCSIVLPDGELLFGGGTNKKVRKHLLDNFIMEKILYAPSGAFEHTGIKSCVFFFRNPTSKELIDADDKPLTDKLEFWKTNAECNEWELMGSLNYTEMEKNNFSFSYDKYLAMAELEKRYSNVSNEFEYKPLGDICKFYSKSKRKASFGKSIGEYNFYTSSDKIKRCDVADYKEELLIIGDGGAANIQIDNNFSCSDHNILCKSKDINISNKYIYYYIKNNIEILDILFTGAGIKNINKSSVKSIKIPTTSIENQQKIIDLFKENENNINDLNNKLKECEIIGKNIFNQFL